MSNSPPSPLGSTGMTILTLGSARVETSLITPVVRSASSADRLSGSMISLLVLSRQPCMTLGDGQAFGNGLGGSGGGGGGDDDGPGLSSGWVVNGCDWAASNRAHPDPTSNAAHSRTITPRMGRRRLMQARLRIVRPCAPRSPPRRGGPDLANTAVNAPRQSSIRE